MKEYFKFGFGFYFGYEVAKVFNKVAGEVYIMLKKRIKTGSY